MTTTQMAFDEFRKLIERAQEPPKNLIANADQLKPMNAELGLLEWVDGQAPFGSGRPPATAPTLDDKACATRHLWAVRIDDVVHAAEQNEFGKSLESRVIKHTNLTGGAPAFAGGELIFVDADTVVINGWSGRYGPKSEAHMRAVAVAFAESGYGIWSMGWDEDAGRPAPFLGYTPQWVSQ
jgi:hypothetical protein